jgi:hypothetical protein
MRPAVISLAELPSLAHRDPAKLPIPPEPNILLDMSIEPDVAEYRLIYSQQIQKLYPQINQETALVLGQMAANRARYGVTYAPAYQRFLDAVDSAILST